MKSFIYFFLNQCTFYLFFLSYFTSLDFKWSDKKRYLCLVTKLRGKSILPLSLLSMILAAGFCVYLFFFFFKLCKFPYSSHFL